jgi:stearoyl-CoA desaturase (delta-9 desaturase)
MVVLGSHGTFWFHRYATHRAFKFKNPFVRNICRNLVIKIVPEEVYVISHHVHHKLSEKPGDPYNVYGGWLYCFLADVNHQAIGKDLTRREYSLLCKLLENTGVHVNSYEQYQKWGSLCHPAGTILHYGLNWIFWYGVFFMIGGQPLALAIFGFAGIWAVGIRTFNYDGHGRGKDRRRKGIDFNDKDISINQVWPGYVAGEWHNNHHLFPTGARSGFLPYQLDLPWLFIRFLNKIGVVTTYRDFKSEFIEDYYKPFLLSGGCKTFVKYPSTGHVPLEPPSSTHIL